MTSSPNFSSNHPTDSTSSAMTGNDSSANSMVSSLNEASPSSTPISNTEKQAVPESVKLFPDGLNTIKTLKIMRSIGYGLLLLSLIDLLFILFPPEFTKPIWEYQTIGDLVRLIPVPMLAFVLVFYGEALGRKRIERPLVKVLSWSTLIFGIFCILMIPLTVVNTLRIGQYNNDQINNQVTQQKVQLDKTKTQLEKATPEQVQSLIPLPDKKTGDLPNVPKNPEEAKNQVLTNIQKAQQEADNQAITAQKNVQRNLIKNSSKIILESLIGGCLFLYTWFVTHWARRRQADAYETVDGQAFPDTNKGKKGSRRRRNF
jgi:hypothetical protein